MKNSKLALIGCGYWGRNYINTIRDLGTASLDYVCDLNNKGFEPFVKKFPNTQFVNDYKQIIKEKQINGAIISTTARTHYSIAKEFLENGIGLLVEKPLTIDSKECNELCEIAERNKIPLMVGNIFRYNSALIKVKEILESGQLGEINYIESTRKGLGPIRKDVGALWDLASHDVYISCYLLGQLPNKVSSVVISHNGYVEDIASLNMIFLDSKNNPNENNKLNNNNNSSKNILSTVYANWEHPIKERKLYVGCTKGAILFDDIEPANKITIFNKGVSYQPSSGEFSDFVASVTDGDIYIPKIINNNPLKDEVEHFINCLNDAQCKTPGKGGYETTKILEAAELSSKQGGMEVVLKW